ncbi:MAG TPA: Fe-S oxidoreductase, partial [Flavobacteriaceae bacterium]|nr:Fe-S oxidoreductase [Flavobacteriaceae bacterium]
MQYIPNILFLVILIFGIGYFTKNIRKIIRNIKLGQAVDASDNKGQRWNNVIRIALGQSKMVVRPIPGLLHLIVYLGFIIINIEVLEIIIDGNFGTHRIFSSLGGFYGFLIASFEILAVLVFVSVIVFWVRRNIIRLKRFWNPEMKGWPKNDGNFILYFEMVLMTLFLIMNATDVHFQEMNNGNIISKHIAGWMSGTPESTLHIIERAAWWLHILGILIFLNYLYFSKHLHIILAFPNVYFGRVTPKGKF